MWILPAMAQMAKNVMPMIKLTSSSGIGSILECVFARVCGALPFVGAHGRVT
jgi:hypothetical protein